MFKTFYLIFKFRTRNPQTWVTPEPRAGHVSLQFTARARAREDEQNVKIQNFEIIFVSMAKAQHRFTLRWFARTTEKPRLETRSEATRLGCPAGNPGRGAPLVPGAAAVAGSR